MKVNKMNDFVGQELEVGDYVAFTPTFRADLYLGKILKIGSIFISVDWIDRTGNECKNLVKSEKLIKLNKLDVTAMILKGKEQIST